VPLAAAAGCNGVVSPIDEALARELGVATTVDARIADGPGALRALVVEAVGRSPLREVLARLAARLASRTPHVLWLLVVTQPATGHVGIAAWTADRRPPRLAALLVDRAHIVDSDAETVRLLGDAVDTRHEADVLTHARWIDVLGREALGRRFYRALEQQVAALGASLARGEAADRREVALLYCSRLLFLSFLEAKGWLDGDSSFLAHGFDQCMASGGSYHRRVLLPLFFGTLNTPSRARSVTARALGRIPFLNGGLFALAPAERRLRHVLFSDEILGQLYGQLFARYRFTAREESAQFTEAAVDPEMLGKAFESLMQADERKSSGSFYTPHGLVERATAAALSKIGEASPETCHVSSLAQLADVTQRTRRSHLEQITVVDPACGSGAFLVHALERIATLRAEAGDARDVAVIRRDVLTHSIFGVDRNPTAVWLCELRLWLSVVIECDVTDPLAVAALPNLDRNVRVGDSLAGWAFDDSPPRGAQRLRRLRERYARSTGPRKVSLARQLDRDERALAHLAIEREIEATSAARRDLLTMLRGRDLFGARHEATSDERARVRELRARLVDLRAERRRLLGGGALPFSFAIHFADAAERGGFDVVLGNPPWVRLHRIPASDRESLRRRYRVFRTAAWEGGAERAHAGAGFAAQVDLAALFVERSLRLLRPGGVLSLLIPVKLWQSLSAGGVRRMLTEDSRILRLEDFSEAPSAFEAAVYPSLLVAERWHGAERGGSIGEITAGAHRRGCGVLSWRLPRRSLSLDDSSGSPWLVLPQAVRKAFDRLRDAGPPLAETLLGRPHLGVKCGFNLAFVVRRLDTIRDDIASIAATNGRCGDIESDLLRPVARGENIRPWLAPEQEEQIVWTHGVRGAPLERLPPLASRWLTPWRRQLAARTDSRGTAWWSLFRTDAAGHDRPRVLWADMGRMPRATLLRAGDATVPLNSCYVAICPTEDDALALLAILNSPLAHAWLAALAEPARGGYHRYLGWTMSLLPTPRSWDSAKPILRDAALSAIEQARAGQSPDSGVLQACLGAYHIRSGDISPLLEWFS
jgi:hypothetical protein